MASSPFRPVLLTPADETALRESLQRVLRSACEDYDQGLQSRQDAREPSQQRWKLIKEEASLRMFRERKSSARSSKPDAFRFLARGTVEGNIEDVAYGCMCTSNDHARLRSAYREEPLQDVALLHVLDGPTHAEPLKSTSLLWVAMRMPLGLHRWTKNPDSVLLDATGFTYLPSGDRVGYSVAHSVELAQCPELKGHTRSQYSSVTLFRQKHDGRRMDIYMQMTLAMRMRVVGTILARWLSTMLIKNSVMTHGATMMKLAWLLRHQQQSPCSRSTTARATTSTCGCCGRDALPAFAKTRTICAVCNRSACSSCLHRKTLFAITPDDRLYEYTRTVCSGCMQRVVELDATATALDEIVEPLGKTSFRRAPSAPDSNATFVSLSMNAANLTMSEDWARLSWCSQDSADSFTDAVRHSTKQQSDSDSPPSSHVDIETLD